MALSGETKKAVSMAVITSQAITGPDDPWYDLLFTKTARFREAGRGVAQEE